MTAAGWWLWTVTLILAAAAVQDARNHEKRNRVMAGELARAVAQLITVIHQLTHDTPVKCGCGSALVLQGRPLLIDGTWHTSSGCDKDTTGAQA